MTLSLVLGGLHFTLPGRAKPKHHGRPIRTKTRARIIPDEKTKEMMARLSTSLWQHRPSQLLSGPLLFNAEFVFAVPESWDDWKREAALEGSIYPTGRPDIDNILKGLCDASTGILWVDDSLIVGKSGWKVYGPVEETRITVIELRQSTATAKAKPLVRPQPSRMLG